MAVADGMIPSVELVLAKPLAWLAEQGLVSYTLTTMRDTDPHCDLHDVDVLILMRACMPDALDLVNHAAFHSVPVIYAIDDDFGALDPETPIGRHYAEANAWQRVLEICANSKQVWAFSKALEQKLLPVQRHVVIPRAISSVEHIQALVQSAQTESSLVGQEPQRKIGYAASHYHTDDIDAIAGVILELLDEYHDLSVEIVGVHSKLLVGHPRVTRWDAFPTVNDYYSFVASRRWTCGIAPLLRTPSNDAKTDNKYREFAALGVPAVYSNTPSYWDSIVDGYNGVLASTPQDWKVALKRLLDDEEHRSYISSNALKDVRKRYSLEAVAKSYLAYIESASSMPLRVVVHAASIPTSDIDLFRPFKRLELEGALEWSYVPYGEMLSDEDLDDADLLVISRIHDVETAELVRRAKNDHGIPVIFSWDDDFFVIPDDLGALTKHHKNPLNIQSLEEILRTVDLVRASTRRIATRSSKYSDSVVVTPYGFDFSQLEPSSPRMERENGVVVIGFFGTTGHGRAVDAVVGALKKVAQLSPNVVFEFFGPRTKNLESLPRVTFIPYEADSAASLRALAYRRWDVGLAPLEVNDFNRAKLPTKYRDYGACHIAGVYSRLDPYEAVVIDGETGFLVDNTEDAWVEALLRLVNSPHLRSGMAAAAHAHVKSELSLEVAVDSWRSLLKKFSPPPASQEEIRAKLERRIQILETRLNHRIQQLQMIRASSKRLLGAYRFPARLPWTPRGLALRCLKLVNRKYVRAIGHALMPVVDNELAREILGHPHTMVDPHFDLSRNLQETPYVEYPIAYSGKPIEANIVRVLYAATIPAVGGRVGVEIVNHEDKIVKHSLLSIEDLPANQVAEFKTDELNILEEGWRIRFFARDSDSPIYVYEYLESDDRHLTMAVFSFGLADQ